MLNHIVLMGRLTRDPELRHTQSGLPVASFSLAVDRDYVPKDGGERPCDFIDIVAWRGTAEFVSKYFSKGRMAVVSGSLQIRDWQDKDGNKRCSAEVVADNIYFGDSKRDSDGYSGQNASRSYSQPSSSSYGQSAPSPYGQPSSGSFAQQSSGFPDSSGFSELSDDDGDLPF